VTIAGYAVLAMTAILLQALGKCRHSKFSPAGVYLATVMRSQLGRWTVLLLWWWVGWLFFVR
jgi:hypothetical protein